MKFYIIAIYLLCSYSINAEPIFLGSLKLKGESKELHFKGENFDIAREELGYKISKHNQERANFISGFNHYGIYDVVFSSRGSSAAVLLSPLDRKDNQQALILFDSLGKKKVFKYHARKLTEEFGWVIELGSVSANCKSVLAKCALMLPMNDKGVSYVRHKWVILDVANDVIKVTDKEKSIDKWSSYMK